jgi:dynein intermediate chain
MHIGKSKFFYCYTFNFSLLCIPPSLVTCSNDGRLCVWNPSNLVEPTTSLDLVYVKDEGKKDDVAVTCMDFSSNETNQLCVGTESGDLYSVSIHGSKPGVVSKFNGGHAGPLTGLQHHPTRATTMGSFGHLCLTSSVDFTVNLWNIRNTSSPLHTFSTGTECIYDVSWSPNHPALFATADGTGVMDIWHINRDIESPLLKINVSKRALNRIAWSMVRHFFFN